MIGFPYFSWLNNISIVSLYCGLSIRLLVPTVGCFCICSQEYSAVNMDEQILFQCPVFLSLDIYLEVGLPDCMAVPFLYFFSGTFILFSIVVELVHMPISSSKNSISPRCHQPVVSYHLGGHSVILIYISLMINDV